MKRSNSLCFLVSMAVSPAARAAIRFAAPDRARITIRRKQITNDAYLFAVCSARGEES
jgi:hypothetical protein